MAKTKEERIKEETDLTGPNCMLALEDRVTELLVKLDSAGLTKKLLSNRRHHAKFTDEAKMIYLAALAISGRKCDSAAAAGVAYTTIIHHRKNDEDFAEAEEFAVSIARDRIRKAIDEEGVEGRLEPIILRDSEGAQNIAGWKRVRNPKILELAAKLGLPEYKERVEHTGEVNIHVGPLGVAPPPASNEEFEAEFGGPRLDPHRIKPVENTANQKDPHETTP